MKQTTYILILVLILWSGNAIGQDHLFDAGAACAQVVRDPARYASSEIDAILYNPAGTALLDNGMSFSLGGVASYGMTQLSDAAKLSHSYKVSPSFLWAYKVKKKITTYTVSLSYASEGGFGTRIPWGVQPIDRTENIQNILYLYENNKISSNDKIKSLQKATESRCENHTFRLGTALGLDIHSSCKMAIYAGLRANCLSASVDPQFSILVNRDGFAEWTLEQYSSAMDIPFVNTVYNNVSSAFYRNIWMLSGVLGLDFRIKDSTCIAMSLSFAPRKLSPYMMYEQCYNMSLGCTRRISSNWDISVGMGTCLYVNMDLPQLCLCLLDANASATYVKDIKKKYVNQCKYSFGFFVGNGETMQGFNFIEMSDVRWGVINPRIAADIRVGMNMGIQLKMNNQSTLDIGLSYRIIPRTEVYGQYRIDYSSFVNNCTIGSSHRMLFAISYTINGIKSKKKI